MSHFLDDADLKKLTGRPQKSRQIEWLRNAGVPFFVSATGHPVVTWTSLGVKSTETAPTPPKWVPRVLSEL